MMEKLKAPFPFFGGKSQAAELVWSRLGNVPNYIEPFAGSLAVLLARPHAPKIETVNDADGFIVNAWRAIKLKPDEVAAHAAGPVIELDLTARHLTLINGRNELTKRLELDPEYCDPKLAGWWIHGACAWIGSGWCSGTGPWNVVDGELVKVRGGGVNRQIPHLDSGGAGVNRQLPHLGNAGRGVNRDIAVLEWMRELAQRLSRARITTGDFERVLSYSVTTQNGLTGVFLDPPYAESGTTAMYHNYDKSVSARAREWALGKGDDLKLRIAICGYDDEHDELLQHGWTVQEWKGRRGYQQKVRPADRIWFSPHCLKGVEDEHE